MTEAIALSASTPAFPGTQDRVQNRTATMAALRHLLRGKEAWTAASGTVLPFDLAAIDSHLPDGGLPCGGLHEIVPDTEGTTAAAFGFLAAILARLPRSRPFIFIAPAYGQRRHGRLSGHGLKALGLDPARLLLAETAHRNETLWALAEALHSGAPGAVAGLIDRLDLKTSQKLQLAAHDCRLPLLLLRPASTLEASAAATRWRIGTAKATRDRFGLFAHPRWRLHLERCRNGRPGEWVVEYDHVAHRFSLVAALADPALSRSPSAASERLRQAG